jgi:hypothetical protein
MLSGVTSMRKLANLAAILLLLGCGHAFGFDYARYQAADLDALLAEHRPRSGIDLHGVRPLRLKVALVAYGEVCETSVLKKSLDTAGITIDLATHPITRCIKIRSAKGKVLSVFIQDLVSEYLPKEVPLGKPVTLYVAHLFTAPNGPGLLVNEFKTDDKADDPAAGIKI